MYAKAIGALKQYFFSNQKNGDMNKPNNPDRIYFHHMVGTGGNSLAAAIAASRPNYKIVQITNGVPGVTAGDAAPLTADKERSLFYGHNLFGLVEKAGIDDRYLTLLRNPYDRLITDFFWMVTHEPGMTAHTAMGRFIDFVDRSEHLEFYIHHCGALGFQNSQHFRLDECSMVSNVEADALARESLDSRFWLVGITELFDESLFVAAKATGISEITPWWTCRHPKTRFRPAFMDLSKKVRSQIEGKTSFDMALYEDYRKKFEARFQDEGHGEYFTRYFNEGHPC